MATMILGFGKNKGMTISECDTKYLKWLVSHVKVLAERNRWASRDAAFELQRRADKAEEAAALERIEALEAAKPATRAVEWSLERCCYVYAGTNEIAKDEDKPKYSVVVLPVAKKERFDLVGHLTEKRESKANLLAACREIKAKARSKRSADLGFKGNFGSKPFSILKV